MEWEKNDDYLLCTSVVPARYYHKFCIERQGNDNCHILHLMRVAFALILFLYSEHAKAVYNNWFPAPIPFYFILHSIWSNYWKSRNANSGDFSLLHYCVGSGNYWKQGYAVTLLCWEVLL